MMAVCALLVVGVLGYFFCNAMALLKQQDAELQRQLRRQAERD